MLKGAVRSRIPAYEEVIVLRTRKLFPSLLILAALACGSSLVPLDWPPAHWIYGEVGVLMAVAGSPPRVLRAGLPLPAKAGVTRRALFSPRRLRHWPRRTDAFTALLRDETAGEIAQGSRVVVDTTRSDLGRLTEPALGQAAEMKESGIIRMVVWDGAHHLPSLQLRPDVIVLPVMADRSARQWVCHGSLRDAVPLDLLLELLDRIGWKGWVVAVPRLSTLAKADRSLAFLAGRVLHLIECADPLRPRPDTISSMSVDGAGTIYGNGEWVLAASRIPSGRLPEVLARGRQAGAARLWVAPASNRQLKDLRRLCRRNSLDLVVTGYPLGVKDLLFKKGQGPAGSEIPLRWQLRSAGWLLHGSRSDAR